MRWKSMGACLARMHSLALAIDANFFMFCRAVADMDFLFVTQPFRGLWSWVLFNPPQSKRSSEYSDAH